MKIIPKGTVIKVECSTGYCGMDNEEYFRLTSDYTEKELDEFAWGQGLCWAESYGIYPDSEEDDDEDNPYSGENIDGWWELVPSEDIAEIEEYIQKL